MFKDVFSRFATALVLAIFVVACAAAPASSDLDEFDDEATLPLQIAESDRVASPEVRAYLDARQRSLDVVATTKTRSGDTVDWIDAQSQVPNGSVATPPPDDGEHRTINSNVRVELDDDAAGHGPDGTVPVLRLTSSRIYAPTTVADFLSRYGSAKDHWSIPDENDPMPDTSRGARGSSPRPPAPQEGSAFGHYYASSRQLVTNFGAEGYLNVWQPFALFPNETSIAELSVSRGSAPKQTIEVGWHVLGRIYGDFTIRFFIYYTTNGYVSEGNGVGGYNQTFPEWVQVSKTVFPGAKISPVSIPGGTQYDGFVKIQLFNGNWWIKFQSEWVGYYPAMLFLPTGLKSQAARVSFFGETFDDALILGMTPTDMGSGLFPGINTWQKSAAYMRNLSFQSTAGGAIAKYAPSSVTQTNPACYKAVGNFNAADAWGIQFYFGGPGQNILCP